MCTEEEVQESIAKRQELRQAARICPFCKDPAVPIVPLGGAGSCWWEHICGAYSQLCGTWEDALTSDWVTKGIYDALRAKDELKRILVDAKWQGELSVERDDDGYFLQVEGKSAYQNPPEMPTEMMGFRIRYTGATAFR